jgi:membrane protein YqaA with SNARE-associated domain
MDIFESYFFLFCDSFFASLILTPKSEMVVKLMTVFSGFNIYFVFFLALFGSVLGSFANFFIGRYFLFLHKTEFFKKHLKEITKAEEKWHKFLVYILILSPITAVGNPFTTLAGFFKTKITKFLLLVGISKFFYYYLLVFHNIDLTHL